ncbi:MAG TPA: FtsW/RodA/SpoVE family cell cycle protein [Vicinamibacterales bacterium]|jgi:cell division protein FtsW (lipid II flippase)|nr:FtsW/RodA/SpoVE family cell cycle protein [Vicinamibacterales bacterium]
MALTYTRALQRDTKRDTLKQIVVTSTALETAQLLFLATSLVALLAVALAYEGRVRRADPLEAARPEAVFNLATGADAGQLETALEPVLAAPADRRFAAHELLGFLAAARDKGEELPNVAVILRATVPAALADRTPGLVAYAERLQRAREVQSQRGATGPERVALFTSADLVLLKPGLSVRTAADFRRLLLRWGALFIAGFYLVVLLWKVTRREGDLLLLSAAHLLTALGLAALVSRSDPLRDSLLFVRYVQGVLVGLVFLGGFSLINLRTSAWLRLRYLPLAAAFTLSLALILFGDGPGTSGAKVNLGPIQPIEAIRLLLALFLAGYFARVWELLRQVNEKALPPAAPSWVRIPRVGYVVPVIGGVGLALIFFFLQKDLGPALMLSCVFLALYAVARGRVAAVLAGSAVLVAGFYLGYRLHISETLAARVAMWQAPWDNAVRGGDQVAQAVWALATGGVFGTGFGLGETRYLPAGHTDLALAALGEELGLVGLVAVGVLYAAITWRGFRAAMGAANDYGFFLGTAVTLFLAVPVLLMGAGLLGVVPLTGVVTPFLSYGGSAMAANFAALGILMAIGAHRGGREGAEPFRVPMRYLARGLGFVALVLAGVLVNVQMVRADRYVVRPHLSLQADGVARYQYNPRVLDLVRALPRGSVFDRAGRVLATGDPEQARQARTTYQKLGVAPNGTCVEPVSRCYPLGGAGFHLLGDAGTRENWSASNSSYVERDSDDRLRGFDDHAASVKSTDEQGRPVPTVRRDYRELVPLLRHRHQPDGSTASAFLAKNRDVLTTIDARLQLRLSQILTTAARRSESGHAAAVVLDAATGDVLAIGSYPFPVVDRPVKAVEEGREEALLDRSRYGLYPPGSTFKLVTAAAALRQNPALASQTFTCGDLPEGRVGVRIPGGRPVRDDVLDHHPHGTIAMHDGLVQSCNAYFAQLAMKLGPEALLDAAATLGISVTPGGSVERLRATLPQAGYGQGDVVATPLRMARVAAALANGGVLTEAHVEMLDDAALKSVKRERLLSPASAATLGRYMRDGVLEGTGRLLRNHPLRIAGKTGTAEVVGEASHSWFVGFAPYDAPAASRRIAFAVIVENAGYGGAAAASTAGDLVTAAASAGLIK